MLDAAGRFKHNTEAETYLNVKSRTLNRWNRELPPGDIGRPPKNVPRQARALLLEEIEKHGENVSRLYEVFPTISRSAIADFTIFWLLCQNRVKNEIQLQWLKPGSVWAMDFLERETSLNYDFVFNVRDLASGKVLAARATKEQTAQAVCDILQELFHRHGAPLVIKSDNGHEFIAHIVADQMQKYKITHLFSPVYFPQYNGACEAGGGAVMTRAMEVAAACGHPGVLTIDALEAGRKIGNAAPRRGGRSSPNVEWQQRGEISNQMREDFLAIVNLRTQETRGEFWRLEAPRCVKQVQQARCMVQSSFDFNSVSTRSGSETVDTIARPWAEKSTLLENWAEYFASEKEAIAFVAKCDRIAIERALSDACLLKVRKG